MDVDPIRIEGLEEFRASLRKLDADLPKVIRLAGNEAAQLIVDDARRHIPSRTGAMRRSLRVASTQTTAGVKLGDKRKAPYAGWIEFGGSHRIRGGGTARRQFRKAGRSVYPSLGRNRNRVEQTLLEALLRIAGQAGVGVDR